MKKGLALIILIFAVILVAVLWWRENRPYNGPVQHVSADNAQIERGRYLALAADCVACHTVEGGASLAGGHALATPFGTIYGTNLTPSADHGIGRWTNDDFYRALTTGIAPGGRHLYPAMPYNSYKSLTRKDSDDLYAYLMTRPAVDVSPPSNELPFPFNQRMLMIGWNLLFYSSKPLPSSSEGRSQDWLRGRYLVNVLGHCGECHTPRGVLGQMETAKILQGGELGRFIAPDITPAGLAGRGWTPDDLQQFMSTGISPQGAAFSEMHMAIDRSTRYLTKEDQRSMMAYLLGDKPVSSAITQQQADAGSDAGRNLYLDQCSGCHARDGEGKPHVAVSMHANTSLRQPDGRNLIVSVLDGLPEQRFFNGEAMQSMPSFASRLKDEEIADLVNYLRVTWGGLPASVTAAQVKALR